METRRRSDITEINVSNIVDSRYEEMVEQNVMIHPLPVETRKKQGRKREKKSSAKK